MNRVSKKPYCPFWNVLPEKLIKFHILFKDFSFNKILGVGRKSLVCTYICKRILLLNKNCPFQCSQLLWILHLLTHITALQLGHCLISAFVWAIALYIQYKKDWNTSAGDKHSRWWFMLARMFLACDMNIKVAWAMFMRCAFREEIMVRFLPCPDIFNSIKAT